MRVRGKALLAALLVMALIGSGRAQAEEENQNRPWSLGLGLGYSTLEPETTGTSRVDDSHDFGQKLIIGYDLTRRLSLEGYYTHLGSAELVAPNGKIRYQGFGLGGLYYFYKQMSSHQGLGAFARLGVGRMLNSADFTFERKHDYHLLFGAGVEYGFANGFALRADMDFYDKDANLIALSLLKRFGTGGMKTRSAAVDDSDGDGVIDVRDQCLNTDPRLAVDASGCPMDLDRDGILNAADACPNTPIGMAVNAKGCPPDGDGDGVADAIDVCPNTPRGAAVDMKGCERDGDSDRVYDSADACPNTPAGAEVDMKGCERDDDLDGIVNSKDRCPQTPPGTRVGPKGCKLKDIVVLHDVTFATDSAELIGNSRKALDEVRETLKRHSDLRMEIAGYTDARGIRSHNIELSQRRAGAVRQYLIKGGIAAHRLIAKGYGPDNPISDNETEAGQALNRRVELHILK